MKKPNPIAYTTKATATGGREGTAQSVDGRLDVQLSKPTELGGDGGTGTNPEQLFAAGYAACFIGALGFAAGQDEINLPEDLYISAEVGLGPTEGGFAIDVELFINLPGVKKDVAKSLVAKAQEVCPYSNATRGNVDVRLTIM
jgi:Ohr subfamily peroxiredoxin